MAKRSVLAAVVLTSLVLAGPVAADTKTQGGEAGLALAAAALNVFYLPAKVLVAAGGMVGGTFAGFFTGGDVRSAYALWVPAAGGTYFLHPSHLDGTEPLEFFGSDYDDRPSPHTLDAEEANMYEAVYGVVR